MADNGCLVLGRGILCDSELVGAETTMMRDILPVTNLVAVAHATSSGSPPPLSSTARLRVVKV